MSLIAVEIHPCGRTFHLFTRHADLKKGDWYLFRESDGLGVGLIKSIILVEINVNQEDILVRKAVSEDVKECERRRETEVQAFEVARELISRLRLSMKLIFIRYPLESDRITFYYTAGQRVDFRKLVKELASVFKVRIQMQQVGVRDEPQLLGGLGICGRRVCCASFLACKRNKLNSVSLEAARIQNLPLVSSKISGICGRLRCCLNFEYDIYLSLKKDFPSLGKVIFCQKERVKVVGYNYLRGTVTVETEEGLRKVVKKEDVIEQN